MRGGGFGSGGGQKHERVRKRFEGFCWGRASNGYGDKGGRGDQGK